MNYELLSMNYKPSPDNLKIVTTADGSATIWNEQMGEHYHSRNGALQESRHVFLDAGLTHYLTLYNTSKVNILEVGFGTGLNFLLSADYCTTNNISLNYTGIEAFPRSKEMIASTGYGNYFNSAVWSKFLDKYPDALMCETEIDQFVNLNVCNKPLLDFNTARLFDIVYFDAFASAKQPEMWTEEAIGYTVKFLKPGDIFVTYAITGNLKRTLKSFGLAIEKIPGAAGKREMLRAIR